MDLRTWLQSGSATYMSDVASGLVWPSITGMLSVLVVLGYCLIAINWYFQSKVSSRRECRPALTQLCIICFAGALGTSLNSGNIPWIVWRVYDIGLLLLAVHTWLFVFRMRGLGLVDERLAQLEELEHSAMRYREIAELLPHMIWTANVDGLIDFSNQRWREYRGDEGNWLQAVHPDEIAVVTARWANCVTHRHPFSMEVRLTGYQGYRTFQINATPVISGQNAKWLGACADVEDQRLLAVEKELQVKQKSFFLNALSHDLRAPLHNVMLNAHLLKISGEAPVDTDTINTIMENATAAGDLVTRLLDFAKVGAHEHNLAERVDLNGLLGQIMRRFQPVAAQKRLAIRMQEDEVLELVIDRHKLERIISNLVDNSIKYTHSGGITLAAVSRDDSVCIRVLDTGVGVPPEHVPYLFDEFYQVNNYERDRNKGFGMGLAICRCLAHQLNAAVRLASTGPAGSCFEIVIKGVDPDRRGRPRRPADDSADSEEARLCGV